MIDVCYVISWRYSDGSGNGTVCAHHDKARAEAMLRILTDQADMRNFTLEAVPYDASPPECQGAKP